MNDRTRGYRDLHEHLDALDKQGLLLRIDRPIDKDSELHPLVRWQFVGGMAEHERKAFLFTNVIDGRGRKFAMPVLVGAIAANRDIYSVGMGVPPDEIQAKWNQAIARPIAPRVVEHAPCQEVVLEGNALQGEGNGLDRLPIPVSTPGFDSAPTLTATNVITCDPETGVQNMGTYRAALKATNRLVIRMATRAGGAGGYQHYVKHQKLGKKLMPCAIVLGCPPCVAFVGPQKLPLGVDELTVAGGLAGAPINVVKARSVDLFVPAEAEIVIEGLIDTEFCEPEAPFGESHGHVALEEFNIPML
ncbi:MAG: UbiD family decarboxylase, partial [Betaproteobacteria bacterium]|nr:UbiD family decarboxylase [Betaproteobacteria bacterium]